MKDPWTYIWLLERWTQCTAPSHGWARTLMVKFAGWQRKCSLGAIDGGHLIPNTVAAHSLSHWPGLVSSGQEWSCLLCCVICVLFRRDRSSCWDEGLVSVPPPHNAWHSTWPGDFCTRFSFVPTWGKVGFGLDGNFIVKRLIEPKGP